MNWPYPPGDEAFLPSSRCPNRVRSGSWPTFVIEVGVSESISRLREDARRWFVISEEGLVRIIIIISIKSTNITFDKWQLAPSNAPRPLTRAYLSPFRAKTSHVPPLTIQLIRHTRYRRSTSSLTELSGPASRPIRRYLRPTPRIRRA